MPGSWRAWGLLLLLGGPILCTAAGLQLRLNRESLSEGESFMLQLESNRWERESPDLSPLLQDFEILANQRSQTFRLLQGQKTQENRWQIELLPKRAGLLRIPPIRIGNDVTVERFIEVLPAGQPGPPGQAGKPLPVFMEVKAEPADPYVHSQVVYTARLYIAAIQISNASLTRPVPTVGTAMVEEMEGARYEKRLDGQRYTVNEIRYRVTPQSSGTLQFGPLEFKGQIGGQRNWVLDWSDFGLKRSGADVRTLVKRSEPLRLQVRPVPAHYPQDAAWLPARQLSLTAQWAEATPDFTVGAPVTRLFTLSADGVAAAQLQLPGWSLPDSLRVYPDQPTLEDRKHKQGSTGILQQGIALIPTAPGTLVLPELQLPWWNVVEDRLEYARLPSASMEVMAAALQPGVVPLAVAPAPQGVPTAATEPRPPTAAANPWWRRLTLLLALAWALTLWWGWRERQAGTPPPAASPEPPPNQSLWVRRLQQACVQGDAGAARAALQGWAQLYWPGSAPAGLAGLARRCPVLAAELQELDRALYRAGASAAVWRGGALWQAFKQLRQQPAPAPRTARTDYLKPLYP